MTPPIEFASLGMWDSLILMVMALVVFGPRRLPEIARQIGRLMYEVRKASNDFKFQMEEELRKAEDADRRKSEAAPQPTLAAPALTAEKVETIEAANATDAAAELPSHAEIDAMFEAVEDWPATPAFGELPTPAHELPATAADETAPNAGPHIAGPNQEQAHHG